MSTKLETRLRDAYLPYARAFLDRPRASRLTFEVGPDYVDANLWMATVDFVRFDKSVDLRREHRRTFNNLVRHVDPRREPTLAFVDGGQGTRG